MSDSKEPPFQVGDLVEHRASGERGVVTRFHSENLACLSISLQEDDVWIDVSLLRKVDEPARTLLGKPVYETDDPIPNHDIEFGTLDSYREKKE